MFFIIKKILQLIYFCFYRIYLFLFSVGILKVYESKKVFVISVGNLASGGAGKTPFVALISNLLSQNKILHAVVSRGYKKTKRGNVVLNNNKLEKLSPSLVGDEPYMLGKALAPVPVFVGNKLRSLRAIEALESFSLAVVDDGFQSFKIKKNINILLIDLSLNFKKYKLMPLGILREPLHQIQRADVVVFTKTNLCKADELEKKKKEFLKFIHPNCSLVLCARFFGKVCLSHGESLSDYKDKQMLSSQVFVGVCGVASPNSFVKLQKQLHLQVDKNFVFRDHYKYSQKDINVVLSYIKESKADAILTTKKDFYKILPLSKGFSLYILDVWHDVEGVGSLESYLQKTISTH